MEESHRQLFHFPVPHQYGVLMVDAGGQLLL